MRAQFFALFLSLFFMQGTFRLFVGNMSHDNFCVDKKSLQADC